MDDSTVNKRIAVRIIEERIRDALESLPIVKYLNKLVNSGQIRFTFQNRYHNTG